MQTFVFPLSSPDATNADRFGRKAANLATLAHAGLPTPGGYAVDAAAYRAQVEALGLKATAREVFGSDSSAGARRAALDMKLGLMDRDIAPEILEELLTARTDI